MRPLDPRIKKAAEDAFHYNERLALMSPEDRETAARWYEEYAPQTKGIKSRLAFLYQVERARFLRGQVDRVAFSAPEYAKEIGWHGTKGGT